MNQPFFITGLPRSGTAWLANLFTTSKSICYHEPLKPVEMLVARNPGRRVGVSDSTLLRRFRETAEAWPDARWLLVVRRPDEVVNSLMVFTGAVIGEQTERIRKEVDADLKRLLLIGHDSMTATIRFDQMTNIEVARQAWHWLLPEVKFDEERFSILEDLNVQQIFGKAAARRANTLKETL